MPERRTKSTVKRRPPREPFGYTIFCDDIREEVGNKLTLVGVYTDRMGVQTETLPIAIPVFGLLARVFVPASFSFSSLRYVVEKVIPGNAPEVLHRTDTIRVPDIPPPPETLEAAIFTLNLSAKISPLLLSENCRIRSLVYLDEVEVKLGSLLVDITLHSDGGHSEPPSPAPTQKAPGSVAD